MNKQIETKDLNDVLTVALNVVTQVGPKYRIFTVRGSTKPHESIRLAVLDMECPQAEIVFHLGMLRAPG